MANDSLTNGNGITRDAGPNWIRQGVEDRLQELWTEAIGLGTSVSRLAVAWTLARPGVDVPIVGPRDPAHIDDLDEEAFARIDTVIAGAVIVVGPSPEGI